MLAPFSSVESPFAGVGLRRENSVSRKAYARRSRPGLRARLADAVLYRTLKLVRVAMRKRRERRRARCATPLARMSGC
ncbi:MAG: hypothetical protein IT464_11270 [Planctomycetes bacterium]|nr:hypothetical protein [Planctomycetota bacterium]